VTFLGWSLLLGLLGHHSARARRLLESSPVVLVRSGKVLKRNLDIERIDREELAIEMRLAGIARLDQVAWAILEPEGKISFIRVDEGDVDPRQDDVQTD